MRKVLYMLGRIRQDQLREAKAPDKAIAEVGDKFAWMDKQMNGFGAVNNNEKLAEVMTSGDFTYAVL